MNHHRLEHTIKSANSTADYQEICELAAAIWEPTYGQILEKDQLDYMFTHIYTPENIANQIIEGQHFFIYYDANKIPKGFAAWSWTQKNYAKLNKIYILPSEHGTGIGRNFLLFIEQTAQQAGATAIWLCVNRYNKARFFYEKQGYTLLREEDFAFGPYWMNDYVFEKQYI
jgi:GNAT superfamily N-acetyltransferase